MPLRLFSTRPNYNFMGKRWLGFGLSILLILSTFTLLFTKGLNLGIDFTGGILIEVQTTKSTNLSSMRSALDNKGFGEVTLQNIGDDKNVMIRIQVSQDDDQIKIIEQVKLLLADKIDDTIDYRKIDYVGPTIGGELVENGIMAVLFAFAAILIYVWFRFEWQYGVGAVFALLHDAIMVLGFFVVTGFDFGLPAIAAILTIVGYSINDTVVIYDRIRENMRRFKKMPVFELINQSVNETMSRTILTAGTTLAAAMALAVFGGEVIKGFSWAIVFGVTIGTYSSVYISAPILAYFNIRASQVAAEANA